MIYTLTNSAKIIMFKRPIEIGDASENRSFQRETCWIKAAIQIEEQKLANALLVDISDGGARIKSNTKVSPGQIIELLGFNALKKVPCQVVWTSRDEIGLKFST